MTTPAQSYSILFSAFLSPLGATVPQGYAVTKSGDGLSYVVASTANLTTSSSGTIDGIQLNPIANPGDTVQVQRDAKVDKAICSWLGTGIEEDAVVDSNGKVQRASVASGIAIGRVDKEGGVALRLGGTTTSSTLAGDVNGPSAANQVWSISGNAGAVSILGGAWSIAAGIALAVTQLAATSDTATKDVTFETQSAYSAAATNTTGGNFDVTLGSNTAALTTPWLNPSVPSFLLNYRDRSAGLVNIASIEPTRFFNAAGIGAGMFLSGGNSWLDIGANPTVSLGVISVDNGTDAIGVRNHLNTADMAVLGTDTSDYVVIARTGTAGVKVAPLAGTGTRVVTADPSGILGTTVLQAAPTGSGVWHSTGGVLDTAASKGTANQVFVTNNLATDTNWATTGGDVTGPITALVVGKLQGSIVLSGTPSNGQVLQATSSTAAHWATISTGGTPGGSSTQMQYNNAGAFGGTSGVTWVTGATNVLNVASGSVLTFGASPAASGSARFSNATAINWRNAAASADVLGITVDSSNQVVVGSTGGASGTVWRTASNEIDFYTGGATRLTLTDTLATFSTNVAMGTNATTYGATPAAAGFIRATNNTAINFRNVGGTADIQALTVDSSNQVILGSTVSGIVCTGGTVDFYAGSAFHMRVDGGNNLVAVPSGNNLLVGTLSTSMNSATDTIYIASGTAPTADPGDVYLYSASSSLSLRQGSTPVGGVGTPRRLWMTFVGERTTTSTSAFTATGDWLEILIDCGAGLVNRKIQLTA